VRKVARSVPNTGLTGPARGQINVVGRRECSERRWCHAVKGRNDRVGALVCEPGEG